jgi:hypothetical protein
MGYFTHLSPEFCHPKPIWGTFALSALWFIQTAPHEMTIRIIAVWLRLGKQPPQHLLFMIFDVIPFR